MESVNAGISGADMSFSITVTVDTQELERIAAQLDGKTDTVVKNIARGHRESKNLLAD